MDRQGKLQSLERRQAKLVAKIQMVSEKAKDVSKPHLKNSVIECLFITLLSEAIVQHHKFKY